MTEYLLITFATFIASLVSFYSGFGLATLLTPVAAIFLPLPVAISYTALMHCIHNILKAFLLRTHIDGKMVLYFGLPAACAAIPGALLLKWLSLQTPLKSYTFFFIHAELSFLHMAIGFLLIVFATLEASKNNFLKPYLSKPFIGGIVSGFFGGLSGYQGALRSLFLVHARLSKESFIATNAAIALAVDSVRLTIYFISFGSLLKTLSPFLVGTASIGALSGIILGITLLKKVTIDFIQKMITVLLYLMGILLILGVI